MTEKTKMKAPTPATVAAGALLAFAASADAATITLTTIDDGTVYKGGLVDTDDPMVSTESILWLTRVAVFEFDLSAIPDDATVTGATVSYTNYFWHPSYIVIDICNYAGDGAVTSDDFVDNCGAVAADDVWLAGLGSTDRGTRTHIGLTDLGVLQAQLADNHYTMLFQMVTPGTHYTPASLHVASLEDGPYKPSSFKPATITVQYSTLPAVPLPASLPLLGAALAGLAALRRQRTRI